MRWELKNGSAYREAMKNEKLCEKIHKEFTPETLPDAWVVPQLEDSDVWLWEAFWTLNSERSIGFGVGPIPWSKRLMYAIVNGFSASDYEEMEDIIPKMDDFFISFQNEKTKNTEGARNAKPSKSKPASKRFD